MSGKKQRSQSGMASFLIVMIMMMVITLIVLGLSQVTRRNQREALDRQLSAQAFYAAESGVNVTAATISSYVKANGYSSLPTKTGCPNDYSPTDTNGNGGPISDLGSGVRYTCVLVDPTPTTLRYGPTRDGSVVFPISANGNIRTLTFTWNMQNGGTNTSCVGGSAQSLPQASAWSCDFGIVRLDLVDDPNNAGNIGNLPANTVSLFLTPLGSHTGTISLPNFNSGDRAYVASASGCSSGTCSVTITLTNNTPYYYARATMLYRDAKDMLMSGTLTTGSAAEFSGAQAVVDTTGQAQDQLHRIQVRVQLTASDSAKTIPANAIASGGDICKHFAISSSDTVDPANLCQ